MQYGSPKLRTLWNQSRNIGPCGVLNIGGHVGRPFRLRRRVNKEVHRISGYKEVAHPRSAGVVRHLKDGIIGKMRIHAQVPANSRQTGPRVSLLESTFEGYGYYHPGFMACANLSFMMCRQNDRLRGYASAASERSLGPRIEGIG